MLRYQPCGLARVHAVARRPDHVGLAGVRGVLDDGRRADHRALGPVEEDLPGLRDALVVRRARGLGRHRRRGRVGDALVLARVRVDGRALRLLGVTHPVRVPQVLDDRVDVVARLAEPVVLLPVLPLTPFHFSRSKPCSLSFSLSWSGILIPPSPDGRLAATVGLASPAGLPVAGPASRGGQRERGRAQDRGDRSVRSHVVSPPGGSGSGWCVGVPLSAAPTMPLLRRTTQAGASVPVSGPRPGKDLGSTRDPSPSPSLVRTGDSSTAFMFEPQSGRAIVREDRHTWL